MALHLQNHATISRLSEHETAMYAIKEAMKYPLKFNVIFCYQL